MHKTARWVSTLLLTAALLPLSSYGDDDDEQRTSVKADDPKTVPGNDNIPIMPAAGQVRLSLQQQRAAGIQVHILTETRQQPEFSAYARVVDIQPLLNLSARHRALQAELTISRTALNASQKAQERTTKLHKEDAASTRSLQQAEAQRAGDAARSAAAEQQLSILRNEALQQWGATLAGWALDKPEKELERLLLRQDVLVELALPPERTLPPGITSARLTRQGDRRYAMEARLVSAAPRTGDITQGETWFAVTPANSLRTGMRLSAWIRTETQAAIGVEFPVTAVLWWAGKPWVYVQTNSDSFARRLIPAYHDHGSTWFVPDTFQPGDPLVINGAQLLLSEEFRGQIPAEGDD